MKLLKLIAENFKKLKVVEITPDGKTVIVRGPNGAGKSSLIDAVEALLGGKDSIPSEPIRRGEKQAHIIGYFDGLTVERTITESGEYLTVKSPEGAKYPSPQTVLNQFLGKFTFDPLSFMRLKPEEQRKALQQLVGLDFAKLDADRKAVYDERTQVNRDVASHEARLKAMPPPLPVSEVIDIEDLLAEQELLQQAQRDNDQVHAALKAAGEVELAADKAVQELDAEIGRVEKMLADLRHRYEAKVAESNAAGCKRTELEEKAAALVDPGLASVRERIKTAQANAGEAERSKQREQLAKELEERREAAVKLTGKLEMIDQAKADRLEAAKFPIEGLSFAEIGVTFKSLPLEQASTSEQLRVAVAIGLALNPKLRLMLVREGSFLDENSLKLLFELAVEADAQLLVEMVGQGDVGILIEDGSVKAVNGVPVEQQSLPAPASAAPDQKPAKRESAWDRIKRACADKGITDVARVRSITKGATGKAKPAELDDGDVTNVESMLRSGVYPDSAT